MRIWLISRRNARMLVFALAVLMVGDASAGVIRPTETTDSMHARYYSPNLGRFMSVDPLGGTVGSSQSWNRYAYVENNPLRFTDPEGEWLHIAIGAVAGGVINAGVKIIRNRSQGKSWNDGVLKATGVGMAAGAVAAGTAGLATGAVATAMGATAATGVPVTAIVVGGAVGGATGGAVQGAGNEAIVEGNTNLADVGKAAGKGAVVGAVAGAAGGVLAAPSIAQGKEVIPAVIDAVAAEGSAVGELYNDLVTDLAGSNDADDQIIIDPNSQINND